MNKPMKICLVSQEYPPETGGGGIGTQTYLRARGLPARGHTVHVVGASWDNQNRTYNDGQAIIHRIAPMDLRMPGYEQSTSWMAYSFAVAQKLAELEKSVRFDIIQFPEYGGEGFIYQTDTFACRKAKYIVQMHGPLAMFSQHWGWPDRQSPLYRVGCFMEKTSLQCADRLLASSAHTARYCQEAYGVDTSGAGVVYSGIDINRFRPTSAADSDETSTGGEGPRILFVGGLSTGKGLIDLILAMGQLKSRFPRIKLRAIGRGDGDQLATISRLLKECDVEHHFDLVGYVPYESLPEQYAWCDLFAAPSVYEGGPGNVYLEAMACGKPVIACNTGGVPEVVRHLETGLLVNPRDVGALAESMTRLAEDAQLRRRLGAAGRRLVEEQFSIERYLDRCERHYQEIL